MMNRRSPCLTIWPSLKCTESMKPETRARTSTLSTAVKRPVNSSHSVMTFCTGCATVTDGGGGAAPAAGLRSQPARERAAKSSRLNRMPRVIGLARALKQRRDRRPQEGARHSHPRTEWEIRQRWRKSQSAEVTQMSAGDAMIRVTGAGTKTDRLCKPHIFLSLLRSCAADGGLMIGALVG